LLLAQLTTVNIIAVNGSQARQRAGAVTRQA
jgi:hypothetical protein